MLGISNIYLSKLKKNEIKLFQVPNFAITQEMCDYWATTHFEAFNQIPEKYRKPEMGIEAVKHDANNFKNLPRDLRTQEVYTYVFEKAVRFLKKAIGKLRGKLQTEEVNMDKIKTYCEMVLNNINPSEAERLSIPNQELYKEINKKLKLVKNPKLLESEPEEPEEDDNIFSSLKEKKSEDTSEEKEKKEETTKSDENSNEKEETDITEKEDEMASEKTNTENIFKDLEKEEKIKNEDTKDIVVQENKENDIDESDEENEPINLDGMTVARVDTPKKEEKTNKEDNKQKEESKETPADDNEDSEDITLDISEKEQQESYADMIIKSFDKALPQKSESSDDDISLSFESEKLSGISEKLFEIPEDERTREMYKKAFKLCQDDEIEIIYDSMPYGMADQEICNYIVSKNPKLIGKIPVDMINNKMYKAIKNSPKIDNEFLTKYFGALHTNSSDNDKNEEE